MRFNKARYVTLCQQSLVTAAVLAVGLSAAGVKTLDIVPQPSPLAERQPAAPLGGSDVGGAEVGGTAAADTGAHDATAVDEHPITPKVREVPVAAAPAARRAPVSRQAPSKRATSAGPTLRLAAESTPQAVHGFGTVGVTWRHGVELAEDQIALQVRTEKAGRWSQWSKLQYHDDHGPDGAEGAEPGDRPGTDALVVGAVDRVQMRAETSTGKAPADLKLAVIDPGTGAMTEQAPAIDTAKLPSAQEGQKTRTAQKTSSATLSSADDASLAAMKVSPKPYIYSRAQWGANEKMREQTAPSYGTIKTGFIHHTVNANNYTSSQVPSLLRGIYAYHTQSRGWRDIGYNFLVDRFGRIWEGRWGGVDKAVVGAHTQGYNEVSFAMSAIGNFDIAQPPQAVLDAYARLFAWKLSMYNISATATHLWVKNRYLNAINGHRDVGQTACPGRYLYAKIPSIRVAAQKIQAAAQGATPPSRVFTSPTQAPLSWRTQPGGIAFPRATNLVGSAYPDLTVVGSDGTVKIVPTGGQFGFSTTEAKTAATWSKTNLVTAVGDVTGDGDGDVLARYAANGVSKIYSGDGEGHVRMTGVGTTSAFATAKSVISAGDWNRDGRADLLVTDSADRLWAYYGSGRGTFRRGVLVRSSWGYATSTAVVGDLTGDGRPDVVAANKDGNLYVLPSTSKGTLGAHTYVRKIYGYDTVLGGGTDLNGDSVPDVVVRSSTTGQVAVITGVRGGLLGWSYGWFTSSVGIRNLSLGQMAGAGPADLVGLDSSRTMLVVRAHNGLLNLGAPITTNLKVPAATQVLDVGDWTRDGKGDLITREGGGDTLVLHPGLGNGKFAAGITMSKGWKSVPRLAAVGDVNKDGFPDLAGRLSNGQARMFLGNGKTGFYAPYTAPASMRTFNQIGTGAWAPAVGAAQYLLSSDGSFVPVAPGAPHGDPSSYTWQIGLGDVDGDGRPDVIARDLDGKLWLLPGTSTGLGARRLIGTGFAGYRLGG